MNRIELTKEQKDRLLEMCKILFPDMNWEIENIRAHYLEGFDQNINNILKGYYRGKSEMDETADIIIHWFEFCIMDLTTKIYNLLQPSSTITLFRGYICQESDHPIDYLYKQFKKLKNV